MSGFMAGPKATSVEELLGAARSVLVVAAHPDDEVFSFGAWMGRLGTRCTLLHLTDGAPRNPSFAAEAGFTSREAYARARREEALAAAAVAGLPEAQCLEFKIVDQEAALALVSLTHQLRELLQQLRPDVVVTHPFEAGHPDHDAAAFVVRAAVLTWGGHAPEVVEFASYHLWNGRARHLEFLPGGLEPIETYVLEEEERVRKQRMYDCYQTQRGGAGCFPIGVERARVAPWYDFTHPPPGRLHYETFESGMTRARWKALASEALEVQRREGVSGGQES